MKKLLTTLALCLAIVVGASTWLSANSVTVNHTWDAAGNVLTSLGTLISGEDPTATGGGSTSGVIVTEQRYLLTDNKVADFQVKASPGFVHALVCIGTDAAATAGTIKLHDALTETTPVVLTFTVPAAALLNTIIFPVDTVFATGIYLGFTTTADVQCYVSYR